MVKGQYVDQEVVGLILGKPRCMSSWQKEAHMYEVRAFPHLWESLSQNNKEKRSPFMKVASVLI